MNAVVCPPKRLRTLGGLVLEGSPFARPKPLLLLAYLATEGPKDRRHVAELFWPHAGEPMTSLRVALSQLRAGAPGALEADGRRLVSRAEADASDLLRRLDEGDLETATITYGEAFLDGLHLRGIGVELEEWVVGTREYLAEKVREAHLRLAEADAEAGHFSGAAARAEQALRVAGAADPTPDSLERLYAFLVAGDSLRAGDLRQEATDYGIALHLTKDEARGRFARGARAATRAEVPHNLRTRVGSFVGRDPERLEVARILGEPAVRIVTLTGQAGVGKSRLALEVALSELRSRRFPHGVFFVALEAIEDPDLVPASIAAAMGVELPGPEAPLDALVRVLVDQRLLLVLDNFEQLSSGATLVAELVARCPRFVVLVTSRDRLNVEGEQRLVVEGLPVPDDGLTLEEAPVQAAVQLFCARARGAHLGFELSREHLPHVVTICRLVGGLPLGIELAAAWVRLLQPAEIAAEMARSLDFLDGGARDHPVRHRSLRAAFEGAWRMLARDEQEVLARLSVFSGGFSREAASRVAQATIPALASLADASLLRVGVDGRFDLHPLLHHFAREKLAADPDDRRATHRSHAAYFAAFAERAEPELKGSQQHAWLERLDADHDNLRAALRRSVAEGDARLGLRIAGALWQFWRVRGVAGEARAWYGQVLALPDAAAPTRERAKALAGAGVLAFAHGAYGDAAALHAEALSLRRALDDRGGTAESLLYLGGMKAVVGALDEARRLFEESASAFRALGNDWGVASALANLGRLQGMQGDLSSARTALEESLAIRFREGDELGAAEALGRLGTLARREGDTARALTLWRDALAIRHRLHANAVIPIALDAVAGLLAARGALERAARLWGASERLRESIGAPLAPDVRQEYAGAVASARASDEERVAAAWAAGRALGLDDAVAEALEAARDEVAAPRTP